MPNPFDQFDEKPKGPNPFDQFDTEKKPWERDWSAQQPSGNTAKANDTRPPWEQDWSGNAFADLVPKNAPVRTERTWREAIGDTGAQLAEGVNSIAGAIPGLVAPESRVSQFFRDNADYWRDKQSDPIKARIAKADQAIQAAGDDGFISQVVEASSQYFSDPVLAARFVVTNLPSMIPGIGAAKLTQAAALARGATAARAAGAATTAAGATNAVLNAGGARSEAFEDIKTTLERQGYSPEQAERMALEDSRVVAAVGAVAGYVSGKTGLEGSLFGKATGKSAVKAAGASALTELGGEQLEEVSPKVTTNFQAGQYDDRSLGKDVGRTMVETAIGSGPGALVSGGAAAWNTRGQQHESSQASPRISTSVPQDTGPTPTNQPVTIIEPTQAPDPAKAVVRERANANARLAELELQSSMRPLSASELNEGQRLLQQLQAQDGDAPNAMDTPAQPGTPQGAPWEQDWSQQEAPAQETAQGAAQAPATSGWDGYQSGDRVQTRTGTVGTLKVVDGTAYVIPDVVEGGAASTKGAGMFSVAPGEVSRSDVAAPIPTQAPRDFWSYAKERGFKPGEVKKGSPAWTAIKADYDRAKAQAKQVNLAAATPVPTPAQASAPASLEAAAPTTEMQGDRGPAFDPSLQNRDRSRAGSVAQMSTIASNPDYMRLGTSRTPDAGAPMVFSVGDDIGKIPEGNEGHSDVSVMADGQRVPFRYAVVDASKVEPSHFADGRTNPLFNVALPGTLKALNNGRTAGLRAAYEQGTAGNYQAELIADAQAHGVSVEAIKRTPNPILVRVYSEKSNTEGMAAKSQGQGLGMSPAELATQDAPLIDSSVLAVYQAGDVASAANRDFVRAFMAKLRQSGQDIATMMTDAGSLSPAGRQRLQAALMQRAYGDAALVQEMFDSLDTDIKAIGEALKTVAGEWAGMRDSASKGEINPDADITGNLLQAVGMVRKARSEGKALFDLVNQADLLTGSAPDPLTIGALHMLYRGKFLTIPIGKDQLTAMLRDYVRGAMSTQTGADLLGDTVTATDILRSITDEPTKGVSNEQATTQEGAEQPGSSSDSGRGAVEARQENGGLRDGGTGQGVGQDSAGSGSDTAGAIRRSGAQVRESNATAGVGQRNEDVGAQLYANRRNFTGRGLTWNDVAGLNDTLKLKEVTKAKIWPRPDYEALVAEGMPPVLARMVKAVYDGLSAGPTITKGEPTDETLQAYIAAMSKVREGLFEFISNQQEVAHFAQGVVNMLSAGQKSGAVSLSDMAMNPKEVSEALVRRVWPEEFKGAMRPFARGTRAHTEIALLGGNKALGAMQFTRSDISKWVSDLGKGWPAKREAWQVQGYRVLGPDEYTMAGTEAKDGSARWSVRPKTGRGNWTLKGNADQLGKSLHMLVQDGGFGAEAFDTREKAIEAAREKVKRTAGVGQDIRGTNIEDAERTGPARRAEGEDITAQRLMDTFGFRGVNFGREGWINQAERQAYLNHAFDGLVDLAELLGVPPKALSLNGELGIAFGAQGKGRAAAHFVPGVNEINLTKTKGAGTVAHEWGHALDHYFAKQAGLAKSSEPFLSEHASNGDTTSRVVYEGGKYVNQKDVPTFGDGIRPEIVQAFRQIYQAMQKRGESVGEANMRRDAALARSRKSLDGWLKAARRAIEDSTASNKADLLADFDQQADKMREGDLGDGYVKSGNKQYSARVAAVRSLIKDATGRLWSSDETNGLNANAGFLQRMLAKKDADQEHEPQQVSTRYKADSLAMDQAKGGKAYWSTSAEMFARAFELYVHDKLSERGQANTFLTDAQNRSQSPVQVPDASSAMARGASATRDLFLYPVGPERDTLRQAFDNLIGQIKTRETEQGVALFNRKDDTYTDSNGNTSQQPAEHDLADIAALESIYDLGNAATVSAGGVNDSARAVHPFRWVPVSALHGIDTIAAAFGKRVVGFTVAPGVLSKKFSGFNGVTFPHGTGNRIFISRDADRPHLAVLGHEVAHQMAKDRPALYAKLVDAIRPYVKANEYGTDFSKLAVARDSYAPGAPAQQRDAAIREEFIGEVLSDGFMDKGFWRALGEKNPSLLRSIAAFVQSLIDKIKATVGYTPRTAKYLSDFDRVMTIAGQIMAEYGVEPLQADTSGMPAFNRNSLGDQEPDPIAPRQQNAWTTAKEKLMGLVDPDTISKLVYELSDKYIDLKNLREHIKEIGGTVTDLNDGYLAEELFHKRLGKRTEDFLSNELKPLLADMRNRGVTLEQLEKYLHARHAPEANEAMAKRNPNRAMIDEGRKKAEREVRFLELKLQTAKANGSATKAIEEALLQARAEASMWIGAQAFRGDENQRLALSGMSDAEAKAHIDSLEPGKRAHLEALSAKVDAMQGKTLETLEEYGLMDKATLQGWRDTYKHYVPLHRDEAHADSGNHPVGQGFSVKGDGAKKRVGSNEKVTHILAHIAMQRETALTRGEKNLVVKKLYLMAAQNPDDDFWSVDNPPKIKTIDSGNGFVRTIVDPRFKHLPNVVMVRIAGRDQAIVFNEHNPQAVRLAESMKNLDIGDLHVVLSLTAKATRWFASVNTQYNPIFGLINFARDVQAGLLNLSTTELAGKQKEVASNVLTAMRAIYRERRGKGAVNAEWARLWDEMQSIGGTTGYRDLYADAKDRANTLAKEIKALDRGEVSKLAHAVVDWLSDYNETMENAVRLSAYKVALDQGMSKERAASLAKNLTVNFNRKGRQAREIGALYAFFNASVQGTVRMAETLRGPLGKKIMYGGVLLGVVNTLIGMAAMGAGDDDDSDNWEQIPEFLKERSIIIPLGREDYLSVPMPLGFHVFPNIGRIATEFAFGGSDKSAGKQLGKMLMVMTDAFNPLGGSHNLGQLVAPTVIDPVVALMQNRDWNGKPIYRENNNPLDPQPGHKMVKDSASTPSRMLAEAINRITGGTDYRPGMWSPTPDQLDYVVGQLTGGLGRELLKVNQTLTAPVTGDELPSYKVPLVGRLYGNTRGQAGQSEAFYANVKELNEIENELKGRMRNGGDTDTLRKDEPLTDLIGLGNQAEQVIQKLRTQRRKVVDRADTGYQERVKEIDARITEIMTNLNQEVSRVRRGASHANK